MSERGEGAPLSADAKLAQGWTVPLPEVMPAPTYSPAVFGLGLMFIGAGLATYLVIAVVGAALIVIGAVGWIGELVEESSKGTAHGHHE